MKHNLHVSVSKAPQTDSLVTCRNVSIREKLLRFLFGKKQRVTVLIPGDTIEELSIKPLGKPTLVPLTDKRPAMNVTNAINEFTEEK